jgi:hypothetical protein
MQKNQISLEVRARQLWRMAFIEGRRDELLDILCRHRGYPAGTRPPLGTYIIDAILSHEFAIE